MQAQNKSGEALPVVFLNSHPIQYYAPLYKYMSQRDDVDLTVVYCSRHGLAGEMDIGFGVPVKWDIPLLEGYQSIFLKNYSPRPNIYGMWGLINWGIISFLSKSKKSILIVHGWGYLTNILALIFGKIFGHIVCIRGDNPAHHERNRSKRSIWLRRLKFGGFIFRFVDYFLYVGKESKAFYQFYGVPERKLLFTPHAVDNERFSEYYHQLSSRKEALKRALELPLDKKVILYSGKYIAEKSPLDLLQAYAQSDSKNDAALVFMGEGKLRSKMEQFIAEHSLKNVYLTGFVNQSKVSEYYAIADVFVMCSHSETWGLSVNEAMNFRLPLILSDLTSCSDDLLVDGINGFLFKAGDVGKLAGLLDKVLQMPLEERMKLGVASEERVKQYSYFHITENLKTLQPKLHP